MSKKRRPRRARPRHVPMTGVQARDEPRRSSYTHVGPWFDKLAVDACRRRRKQTLIFVIGLLLGVVAVCLMMFAYEGWFVVVLVLLSMLCVIGGSRVFW